MKARNPEFQSIVDDGESLKLRLNSSLDRDTLRPFSFELRAWFNSVRGRTQGFPYYGAKLLDEMFESAEFYLNNFMPKEVAARIDRAIEIVASIPGEFASASTIQTAVLEMKGEIAYEPNTAFIMMWMDASRPELQDVCNVIKEVFGQFGIRAFRADDVEHQDVITTTVLRYIENSEFLIADLTGERPNVYYEVGYAHAKGKRPILYRRRGTALHFDLSVHNAPEYDNLTDLKHKLQNRLEVITGKTPT